MHITYDTKWASFLCLGKFLTTFLSLNHFLTVCFQLIKPLYFQCCEASLRVFLMWFIRLFNCLLIYFGGITSSKTLSSFLITITVLVTVMILPSVSPLAEYLVSQMVAVSAFPWPSILPKPLLKFQPNFTCSIITFHSFAALSSLWATSLIWLSIFVQCSVGLSLGNKEVTHLCDLLPVHKLNNRCKVTIMDRLCKKETIGYWTWCTSVIYVVICWLER